MDLSENRTNHPNLIQSVEPHACTIGRTQYKQSIIIPSNGEIVLCPLHEVDELTTDTVNQLCQYEPEVIILATGDNIIFPDPEILTDLLKKNIGLEVLNNQAAARTFNVLLSENRQTVCLMLLSFPD